MFLYIEDHKHNRKQFKILDYEDLKPLFELFPRTEDIALSSDNLKNAAEKIARYISSGYLNAWVEFNELEKGLKEKATALGLSLAASMVPNFASTTNIDYVPKLPTPIVREQPKTTDFGTHPEDRFLWNVRENETSGGINLAHKPVKHGKFKGETALGQWGLLKPTVDEILHRMKLSGKLTPEYERLTSMDRNQLDSHLKQNPQIELNLVRNLASHVLKRQRGNQHKAAYAWLNGHNLFPSDISEQHLLNSDYVSKYKKADRKNPFKAKSPSRSVAMNKQEISFDTEFAIRLKNWFLSRTDEKTKNPMRDRTFVPDLGRRREKELDHVTADSQKTNEEKLKNNIKQVNKRR